MNRRIRLIPYGPSNSARALAARLGIRRLRTTGVPQFRPRPSDLMLNWGKHTYPTADWNTHGRKPQYLNPPEAVWRARDKLACFQKLTEASVPTVEWTIDKARAIGWVTDGHDVFVRETTTGQGGAGINVVPHDGPDPHVLPDAPLYTKRFRARHEYRVHVIGDATFAQKKRRRNGTEPNAVRNHANGYVYCTNGIQVPDSVTSTAIAAVKALNLDFGAVDLLANDDGVVRVLEVNTAPGLEGRTLDFYAEQLAARL